jgi:hypothetical protein
VRLLAAIIAAILIVIMAGVIDMTLTLNKAVTSNLAKHNLTATLVSQVGMDKTAYSVVAAALIGSFIFAVLVVGTSIREKLGVAGG